MAGSYDQFFHDHAARESVGMFGQNASLNDQALGANGLNDLDDYKDDGRQQGGTQTATASYADCKTQDLTLSSAFGAGVHDVAVSFLDDAWGGTPSTDRTLYADSIDDDGRRYASATAAPTTNGTVHFHVGAPNANAT